MAMGRVEALWQAGQSLWLDNLTRRLLISGELARLLECGIRGVTSNPTIFEKAITGSVEYDEDLRRAARAGQPAGMVLETLIVEDIQRAADLLRPFYEASSGADGFVSLEVPPRFAYDTAGTVAEAKRLAGLVHRPNVMIKVPGTRAGVPAVEQLVAEGYRINITLLFSVERYEQVVEAYLRGLEHRVQAGRPVAEVASVASFFVSRVDTAVDKHLEAALAATMDPARRATLTALLGHAAIANATLAHERCQARCASARFRALQAKGAQVQRVLWASTSSKNPRYGDLKYVEGLIGPDTVNTVPPSTLEAFLDHGTVRATLTDGAEAAHRVLAHLAQVGIDLSRVTQDLEDAGVKAFADSSDALLACVEARRLEILELTT